ncbi:hypothetical protein BFL36_07045 [Clavibacter michiganensis]|uniref:Ribbon-helix-helix protein CopG domain-containing protein n=1 Tax=Clavibacter michiganensis TaxID=28447 RepID=A0A251YI54_9MICO|nr:hypothetical protein [Clavibacter michiganensis]OUE23932.1 hypothetical protein BFL36_07045 [Clavibacter michiganensis]
MTDMTEDEYEELARRLTDPATPVRGVGPILTGEAAAAHGRAFMLREYGSMEAIEQAIEDARRHEAEKRAAAGPDAGPDADPGPSPASASVVRAVISAADSAAFRELERRSGLEQDELVRRAVHELLVAEKLVS